MNKAALGLAIFIALGSVASAQNGAAKKKPKKKKPVKVRTTTYDLYQLAVTTQEDAEAAVTKPLGARHRFEEVGRYGAPGRTFDEGRFRVLEKYVFRLAPHYAVRNITPFIECGKLLKATVSETMTVNSNTVTTLASLELKRPLADIDLFRRFTLFNKEIEQFNREQTLQACESHPRLKFSRKMNTELLKDRLLRYRKLTLMREVESFLYEIKVFAADRRRRAKNLTLSRCTPATVIAVARELSDRVEDNLFWRFRLEYLLDFAYLGRGAVDRPTAAFVPGSLSGNIGSIHVTTSIRRGRKRVLWYRLPGYDESEQVIDGVRAPKGWILRSFPPGPTTRGALIFLVVPEDGFGRLDFDWRRKDARGSKIKVQRPADLSYPY